MGSCQELPEHINNQGYSGAQPEEEWLQEEPEEILEPERVRKGLDAVGDYLASIAKYPLLTWDEELQLGLAVETWLKLKELRQEFQASQGRLPRPAELRGVVYQQLVPLLELLYTLASVLGEWVDRPSLAGLLSLPQVRSTLDGALSPKVKNTLAETTKEPEETVTANIVALSALSRLLPPFLIELLEVEGREATALLESHEATLEGWWQQVGGQRCQEVSAVGATPPRWRR